jgi:type II secretory pathway pseudopilin PulG
MVRTLSRARHRATTRAFSLLEVSVILLVLSISAAVVVPVQISSLRAQKADTFTRQVQIIIDGARRVQFYNSQMSSEEATTVNPVVPVGYNRANDFVSGYAVDNGEPEGTPLLGGQQSAFIGMDHELFGSWPGQNWGTKTHVTWTKHHTVVASVTNSNIYKCRDMMDPDRARLEIAAIGNLVSNPGDPNLVLDTLFRNPWNCPILLSLDSPGNGDPTRGSNASEYNCWFTITTDVPSEVAQRIRKIIPNGLCNFDPMDAFCSTAGVVGYVPPPNFVRCCGSIARPGWEPRIRWWWTTPLLDPAYCNPWKEQTGVAGVLTALCPEP